MPELPEVECLRRSLIPHVLGKGVVSAILRRSDMLEVAGEENASAAAHLLAGCRVVELRRHGKQLAVVGEKGARRRVLVIQLGMTGHVGYLRAGEPLSETKHVHAEWTLESGGRLVFRDPRRFGGLSALGSEAGLAERWGALGPDALTIKGEELVGTLGRSQRAVKAALLDQGVLAGVGNIYADESLFRAGLHPLKPSASIPRAGIMRLAKEVRGVLAAAVRAGG